MLNPSGDHLVHIRVETPSVVFIPGSDKATASDERHKSPLPARSRSSRFFAKLTWLIKIVILPIGTTTGCLYMLLLYLLKDAELLEAQRNKPDADSPIVNSGITSPLEGDVTFTSLPRAVATDIGPSSCTPNLKFIASVSTDNEMAIWCSETKSYLRVDVASALQSGASLSLQDLVITQVALEATGRYCAIGTDAGVIAMWELRDPEEIGQPLVLTSSHVSPGAITDLKFLPVMYQTRENSTSQDVEPSLEVSTLVAIYGDGLVSYWDLMLHTEHHILPTKTGELSSVFLSHTPEDQSIDICFAFNDGSLELQTGALHEVQFKCLLQAGSPSDPVTSLATKNLEINGSSCTALVAATYAGVISIWDTHSGECFHIMDDTFGRIVSMNIASLPSKACQTCRLPLAEGFILAFMTAHSPDVFLYRFKTSCIEKRCICLPLLTPCAPRDAFGRRSRSSSIAGSPLSSFKMRPTKQGQPLASLTSDSSAFPISGHGILPRRAGSEKDSMRRISEALSTISSHAEEQGSCSSAGPSGILSGTTGRPHPVWADVVAEDMGRITCERGEWALMDSGHLIGVRKRPRLEGRPLQDPTPNRSRPSELPRSVLDRWELWTFDTGTTSSTLKVSSLSDLHPKRASEGNELAGRKNGPASYPRLPFTRVRPLVVGVRGCAAGFGNTVGVVEFH